MARLPTPVRRAARPALKRFRHATRSRRMLPTFLIIGAQRAGTTSLFDYLLRHPDVSGPRGRDAMVSWSKEIHFFDEKFGKGVDWYRSFFPLEATRARYRRRGRNLQAGEATPYYMFHPAVPARVAETVPDVKLIAILRDPVERAYSHFQLNRRKGREKLSFEEALAAEPERLKDVEEWLHGAAEELPPSGRHRHPHHRHRAYLRRGLYAEQLERWLERFPREQLLVVQTEKLLAAPAETYSEVLNFLGLRDWRLETFEARNKKPYARIEPEIRARLEEAFAEPNARLERLLGVSFSWGTHSVDGSSVTRRSA
ncbi:MAG TPA: sulfotransferase domain-containing protein [Gaiellaceae bacterium]|nr:sulfotransferase domain-containing protein [Gaiellaceae bacterium]